VTEHGSLDADRGIQCLLLDYDATRGLDNEVPRLSGAACVQRQHVTAA